MKDKLKVNLLKIGYTIIALFFGISLKTLAGMYLGHSVVIAWLGNSLILFPTLGVIYYIWQKKEQQTIQQSILNNNAGNNLEIRHNESNTNENNVKTSDEYKEIIAAKIKIVDDSIRNGTLSPSEGAEIITSLNNQLSLFIETSKSSAKYETAKNDLLKLLNNDLISQNVYMKKAQELLDEHQNLIPPELISPKVEIDKSWTKEHRVYYLDNRGYGSIVLQTLFSALFISALFSLVMFVLNKINNYEDASIYIGMCVIGSISAISSVLFKRIILLEIDPSQRTILFKTNYLLLFNRQSTIKFDDVAINLKVKKKGEILDSPAKIILKKSFDLYEIELDEQKMPLNTFTELFTQISELTTANQNQKHRKFI